VTAAPAARPLASDAQDSVVEIVAGDLEVRLARNAADIDAAQALRYKVFYEEMHAQPTPEMAMRRRDFDVYDAVCDHLLVTDRRRGHSPEAVVGTYRLIRRAAAQRHGHFYSAAEYDIAPLVDYPGEILELGRSCVHPSARNMAAMQLLWRGIAHYVFHYNIELMFGCASLPGTDVQSLALPLSYLHQHHLAPPALRARALPQRYVDMNIRPSGSYDGRKALNEVPPLIKGYLRLGGFVGDGAVIDRQFNTVDVCIVVKTELITEKYYKHYERGARDSNGS
jgi:putative hemolysin